MPENDFTLIAIAFSLLIALLIYIRLNWHYNYWQRQNIPFIKPKLLLGNLGNLLVLRTSFGDFFKSVYDGISNKEAPVVGMFLLYKPALLIRDPELIRKIFIKNFNLFLNRYEAADGIHDSMGYLTLPLAKYPIWRESRKRMTEFFTSGKLKERMYPLILEVSLELEHHLAQRFKAQKDLKSADVIIEVKELCAFYTTDLTALLSFSIQADSLKGNLAIHRALVDMLNPNMLKAFHFFMVFFLPHLTSSIRAKVFPAPYVKFIRKMLENNLKQRNNAADYKDDLIDLLMNFQKQSKLEKTHKFAQHPDFIASQVAIMLIAGFETSSSSIAFILFELAKQPAIQQKLRSEIRAYLQHGAERRGTISYKDLLEMPYLNMVVAEGLRMYPSAAFINREFTPDKDVKKFSLKPFVDFDLSNDKSTSLPIYVSILGLHRDEKYWPNPHRFDPERFQPERTKFIHPMTYIPFGVGPHSCIGSRLGVIQVKLGLVHILKKYIVECCDSTPEKIIFEPKSFMLQNKGGIELKFIEDCS